MKFDQNPSDICLVRLKKSSYLWRVGAEGDGGGEWGWDHQESVWRRCHSRQTPSSASLTRGSVSGVSAACSSRRDCWRVRPIEASHTVFQSD